MSRKTTAAVCKSAGRNEQAGLAEGGEPYQPCGKAVVLTSPLAGWMGGKWLLSRIIVPLIPEHMCYCEVFFGAGWIFFRKPPSPIEIVNDFNSDLINLYRVIQGNPGSLFERMKYSLHSRELFEAYRDMPQEVIAMMSREERAWRLLYLLKHSFAGRNATCASLDGAAYGSGKRPNFIRQSGGSVRFSKMSFDRIGRTLRAGHERLKDAIIENMPWEKCLKCFDNEKTFFYLDPPYMGYEDLYGAGLFDSGQYALMAERLAGIKGHFILSINDNEKAREFFGGFRQWRAGVKYNVSTRNIMNATELLVCNYDFEPGKCGELERVQ